jgi:hypothetical protein
MSRYYTTAKTWRLISALLIVLGINIIYQEISWQRLGKLVYNIIFILGHANILSMIIYYILYGVKKRLGKDRAIITLIMLLFFSSVFLFNGSRVILQVLSGSYVILIFRLLIMVFTKKTNGDNKITNGGDEYLDTFYFDYVSVRVNMAEVSFPLDIEDYRHDRGKGFIKDIGFVKKGKYIGEAGALIKSGRDIYLCPLDKIMINSNVGTTNTLAKKGEDIVVLAEPWEKDKSKIIVIGKDGVRL